MVHGVLGYKIFVPILDKKSNKNEKTTDKKYNIFHLRRRSKKSGRQIVGKCERTSEGFVVLAGSDFEEKDSDSIPKTIAEFRNKCVKKVEIKNGKTTKDYLFNSPSYAASFLLGMTTNGRTDWKKDGITLKDLEEKEISDI